MEPLQSPIWITASSYMGKYWRISTYIRSALPHIWLFKCSTLNFLIYEENLIFFFLSVYLFGDGLDDWCGGLYGWARYRHGLLDEIVRHRDGAPQEFRRDIQALYDGLTSPVQCFLKKKTQFFKDSQTFHLLQKTCFFNNSKSIQKLSSIWV